MTIGAYRGTQDFARAGWRLTLPGGPAGGHYKGFTHTESAGTDIQPGDNYEQDREDGMSSHDAVHATLLNPRGVYRSSAEVPPRPNASGSAHTYRGFQTQRHAGTSVAPGSFPADYFETLEDMFVPPAGVRGMGISAALANRQQKIANIVRNREIDGNGTTVCPAWGCGNQPPTVERILPATGATSVVAQPQATPLPTPPAQAVLVMTQQPVSPTPGPIVATNEVIPLNDGSGNFINISTGAVVPGSSVQQNPATGQVTTTATAASTGSGALSWLEQNTIFSAVPNWGVLAGGALLLAFATSSKGRR